jgi:hypothetical protein
VDFVDVIFNKTQQNKKMEGGHCFRRWWSLKLPDLTDLYDFNFFFKSNISILFILFTDPVSLGIQGAPLKNKSDCF